MITIVKQLRFDNRGEVQLQAETWLLQQENLSTLSCSADLGQYHWCKSILPKSAYYIKFRAVGRSEYRGGGGEGEDSNVVGIICPPGIGLTDLTKSGGVNCPPAPTIPTPLKFLGCIHYRGGSVLSSAVSDSCCGVLYSWHFLWILRMAKKVSFMTDRSGAQGQP